MTLTDLPRGHRVVIDANILVYHFLGQSEECSNLVRRIERREVVGWLPAHTALEVLHRLMLAEAVEGGLVPAANATRRLAEHPERVRSLSRSLTDFADLPSSGLQFMAVDPEVLARVPGLCRRYGLMANDAALVAFTEHHGVRYLASADRRLESLHGITVLAPGDL